MNKKKSPTLIPTPEESPVAAAERLLRRVLPEELYLSAAATGEFTCEINKHRYTFKRKSKTIFERDGKRYSCCIDLTDTSRPDADRIVAEYLLALNNEKEYLETANLTEIWSPTRPQRLTFRTPGVRDDGWFERNMLGIWPREEVEARRQPTGTEIELRRLEIDAQIEMAALQVRPPWISYDPTQGPPPMPVLRYDRITSTMIANAALWQLIRIPPLDHQYPIIPLDFTRGTMQEPTVFSVALRFETRDLYLSIDDFAARILRPVTAQLAASVEQVHIAGFLPHEQMARYFGLGAPDSRVEMDAVTSHSSGVSVHFVREYYPVTHELIARLDLLPIVRR